MGIRERERDGEGDVGSCISSLIAEAIYKKLGNKFIHILIDCNFMYIFQEF